MRFLLRRREIGNQENNALRAALAALNKNRKPATQIATFAQGCDEAGPKLACDKLGERFSSRWIAP